MYVFCGRGGVGKKTPNKQKKTTTKQTNNEPNIICEGMFLLKFVTAPPPPLHSITSKRYFVYYDSTSGWTLHIMNQ